ncbi:hypothetical protein PENSPDRAFT_645329 [Peniophora sp. CONT]|nr:hypothetical protein PENSPDRAFT_645329 [Peniophora sp. CONT]
MIIYSTCTILSLPKKGQAASAAVSSMQHAARYAREPADTVVADTVLVDPSSVTSRA